MKLSVEQSGDFKNLEKFLSRMSRGDIFTALDKFGREGVSALRSATPVDSGASAASWGYEITRSRRSWALQWTNSHTANGIPIVILLQYGHGTGTGGYVQGRDFINPAIKPVFDRIADGVWKVVTSA